jgi:hypothetical protein
MENPSTTVSLLNQEHFISRAFALNRGDVESAREFDMDGKRASYPRVRWQLCFGAAHGTVSMTVKGGQRRKLERTISERVEPSRMRPVGQEL